MASVKVYGMKQTLSNTASMLPQAMKKTADSLHLAGSFIRAKAVEITPVDSGELVKSSFVTKPLITAIGASVVVGYGAPYAERVHEYREEKLRGKKRKKPTSQGNYWDPAGESAFLEKAVIRNIVQAGKIAGKELKATKYQFPRTR